jgi:hypothetical protein
MALEESSTFFDDLVRGDDEDFWGGGSGFNNV